MVFNIRNGIKNEQAKIVSENDTAAVFGSGLAKVFSTPSLVALMENTAYKSVENMLPHGFSTVGIEINIKHKKATLPGKQINCKSVITKVDGKKIFFQISAFDQHGEVGTASHIRYIIDDKKFMDNLK
ncbi:MAG: thioesterase family protein [Bacteroidales bacterium]|nr:thioesterase family protein [Bacteroidales bacterium]